MHFSYSLFNRGGRRETEGIGSSGTIERETEDSKSKMKSLFTYINPKGAGAAMGPGHGQVACGFPKCGVPPYVCSMPYPLPRMIPKLFVKFLFILQVST